MKPQPIFLAIPAIPWMWTRTMLALWEVRKHLPPGSLMAVEDGASSLIHTRNKLVQAFLSTTLPWLLFVDADMLPPPDLGPKLLRAATGRKRCMVSGLYAKRAPPFDLCLQMSDETKAYRATLTPHEEPVFPVLRTGMAANLIHRSVFEGLNAPWFDVPGDMGSDYQFCDLIRDHGATLWVDSRIQVPHLGLIPVTPKLTAAWHQMERLEVVG